MWVGVGSEWVRSEGVFCLGCLVGTPDRGGFRSQGPSVGVTEVTVRSLVSLPSLDLLPYDYPLLKVSQWTVSQGRIQRTKKVSLTFRSKHTFSKSLNSRLSLEF